jgi:hypothetical protein
MSPTETRAFEQHRGGWTRVSAGNYERDGWAIQKIRSEYGDDQWVVDKPEQPSWGQFDTLGEAKTAVDRAAETRAPGDKDREKIDRFLTSLRRSGDVAAGRRGRRGTGGGTRRSRGVRSGMSTYGTSRETPKAKLFGHLEESHARPLPKYGDSTLATLEKWHDEQHASASDHRHESGTIVPTHNELSKPEPDQTRAPDVVTMTMSDGRQYPQNADGMVNVETDGSGAWVLPDTLESMIQARGFEDMVDEMSDAEVRVEHQDLQESLENLRKQESDAGAAMDAYQSRAKDVYGPNRYKDWPASAEMHMRELEERGRKVRLEIAKTEDTVAVYEKRLNVESTMSPRHWWSKVVFPIVSDVGETTPDSRLGGPQTHTPPDFVLWGDVRALLPDSDLKRRAQAYAEEVARKEGVTSDRVFIGRMRPEKFPDEASPKPAMTGTEEIQVGDRVTAQHSYGTINPRTNTYSGVVWRDDEGTLRVGPKWDEDPEARPINVTRDENGYFPRGVLLISHEPAGDSDLNPSAPEGLTWQRPDDVSAKIMLGAEDDQGRSLSFSDDIRAPSNLWSEKGTVTPILRRIEQGPHVGWWYDDDGVRHEERIHRYRVHEVGSETLSYLPGTEVPTRSGPSWESRQREILDSWIDTATLKRLALHMWFADGSKEVWTLIGTSYEDAQNYYDSLDEDQLRHEAAEALAQAGLTMSVLNNKLS